MEHPNTFTRQTLSGIRSRLSRAMSANWDDDPTARALGRRIASAYDVMAWSFLQSLDPAGTRAARLQAVQYHATELVGSLPARHVLAILNDQISAELGDDPSTTAAVLRPMKAAQE